MSEPDTHKLIAGNLCLDFINTKNGHKIQNFNEYISNYQDIIVWSARYGSISNDKSKFLQETINQLGSDSSRVHKKIIEFRESLYDIFYSVVHKKGPPTKAIKKIVTFQKKGAFSSELINQGNGFTWTWDSDSSLESIIWPIAFSATKLLTSIDLNKVRICDGIGCDWFFLDRSRNQKRRWCSMEDCGNRSKMRERYRRQKNLTPINK